MKYPVIIAAHNEEQFIGRTLDRLDAATTEPIVIANGCEDNTATVARSFGATVIDVAEKGKLPAIQTGLRFLGDRALDPVLMLDADSYPFAPKRWASRMTAPLAADQPACVSGPIFFTEAPKLDTALRSGRNLLQAAQARLKHTSRPYGANMAFRLHDQATLETVLEAEHVWRGDDRYLRDVIQERGAAGQAFRVGSAVVTSARYLMPLQKAFGLSREERLAATAEVYDARAADSVKYAYGRQGELEPVTPPPTAVENLPN